MCQSIRRMLELPRQPNLQNRAAFDAALCVEKDRSRHHQLPIARVCAATGSSGVPLGAHTAWLSIRTSGWPLDITRVAATTHCPVTQGTGLPETLKGQPATT